MALWSSRIPRAAGTSANQAADLMTRGAQREASGRLNRLENGYVMKTKSNKMVHRKYRSKHSGPA
jgi:hypothetical protein